MPMMRSNERTRLVEIDRDQLQRGHPLPTHSWLQSDAVYKQTDPGVFELIVIDKLLWTLRNLCAQLPAARAKVRVAGCVEEAVHALDWYGPMRPSTTRT